LLTTPFKLTIAVASYSAKNDVRPWERGSDHSETAIRITRLLFIMVGAKYRKHMELETICKDDGQAQAAIKCF
jgi:hypothetical protein